MLWGLSYEMSYVGACGVGSALLRKVRAWKGGGDVGLVKMQKI